MTALRKVRSGAIKIALLAMIVLGAEWFVRWLSIPSIHFVQGFTRTIKFDDNGFDLRPGAKNNIYLPVVGSDPIEFSINVDQYGHRRGEQNEIKQVNLQNGVNDSKSSAYVFCIGDSFTMGWGVEYEDSYPVKLQSALRERERERERM